MPAFVFISFPQDFWDEGRVVVSMNPPAARFGVIGTFLSVPRLPHFALFSLLHHQPLLMSLPSSSTVGGRLVIPTRFCGPAETTLLSLFLEEFSAGNLLLSLPST